MQSRDNKLDNWLNTTHSSIYVTAILHIHVTEKNKSTY